MAGRRRALLVAALGAGIVLLGACDWVDGQNTAEEDINIGEQITGVRVANDAGSVTVRTGTKTSVHRGLHFDRQRPGPTHRVENGVLVIEPCPVRECWIDYELVVPSGTRVDGEIDSGRVELDGVASVNLSVQSGDAIVRGVAGQVNLDAASGAIHLVDIGDTVVVRSDSGSVTVEKARGAVTAETDSGDVTVQLDQARSVSANADNGSVSVTVPRGAYRVTTNTDSGTVENAVTSDPGAANHLELSTDNGRISVRYA